MHDFAQGFPIQGVQGFGAVDGQDGYGPVLVERNVLEVQFVKQKDGGLIIMLSHRFMLPRSEAKSATARAKASGL